MNMVISIMIVVINTTCELICFVVSFLVLISHNLTVPGCIPSTGLPAVPDMTNTALSDKVRRSHYRNDDCQTNEH